MTFVIVLAIFALLFRDAAAFRTMMNSTINVNPDTVDELDVPAYLGLWYQMAADQIVYSTFEENSFCDTALYGDNGDGTISVHNYAKIGGPSGEDYVIDGYAYQTNAEEEPGQLKVVFDSDDAAPFPAPYWVLELGPKNADGLYDYAIVSDNLSLFLFVLARDVDTFNTQYKESVSASLEKMGFTGYTAPIWTYQEKDCVYESTRRQQQMKKLEAKTASAPETVDSLDVNAYVGLWYNVLEDPFVSSTTLRNLYCSTAKYALQADGSISVHNAGRVGSPTGEASTIDGYAYAKDSSEPGKLTLHFNSVPVDGQYWVLATGPVVSGQYDWSIVSDNTGVSLYVLARDVATFRAKYEQDVLKQLADMGFDGVLTKPVESYQGDDCIYE